MDDSGCNEPSFARGGQLTASSGWITAADLRVGRLRGEVHASSGDPLRLTRLFGISDPAAIRYCAEFGQRGYDEHQAREGAAGSAGRTESTSASR